PPVPVCVGSPPWITKPGTIRWKTVLSKKPAFASETSEADVAGAESRSRVTVNEPQFVLKTSLYVFSGSSRSFGSVAPPSARGAGAATCVQPSEADDEVVVDDACVVAAAVVSAASPEDPPQPAATSSG